jgi:hypothetical protein
MSSFLDASVARKRKRFIGPNDSSWVESIYTGTSDINWNGATTVTLNSLTIPDPGDWLVSAATCVFINNAVTNYVFLSTLASESSATPLEKYVPGTSDGYVTGTVATWANMNANERAYYGTTRIFTTTVPNTILYMKAVMDSGTATTVCIDVSFTSRFSTPDMQPYMAAHKIQPL